MRVVGANPSGDPKPPNLGPSLSALDELYKTVETDPSKAREITDFVNAGVEKLIQEDALKSSDDFLLAGKLTSVFHANEIENATRQYQLFLVALAMGHQAVKAELPFAWDQLLRATGRLSRIGTATLNQGLAPEDLNWVSPAPEVIRQVLLAPDEFRSRNAGAKDNEEIHKLVDADQEIRKKDWVNLSQSEMKKIRIEDQERLRRITALVNKGIPKTANDFVRAALVCQHGSHFMDYELAHELCLCSLLTGTETGRNEASWLAGASFDRMLLSASYPQRFNTQFISDGQGKMVMQRYTTEGVNDTMRKAVVHKTLAESLARASF